MVNKYILFLPHSLIHAIINSSTCKSNNELYNMISIVDVVNLLLGIVGRNFSSPACP